MNIKTVQPNNGPDKREPFKEAAKCFIAIRCTGAAHFKAKEKQLSNFLSTHFEFQSTFIKAKIYKP
jgi:hypothetical protein